MREKYKLKKPGPISGIAPIKISHNKNKTLKFPQKIPASFAMRIDKNNPKDPLLLQVLPQAQEEAKTKNNKDYKTDPLCESDYSPLPGLLHKYYGRALLLLTKSCPINCRFCFRRYMRNQVKNWPKIFAYLAKDKTISEVILSGGEPLLWNNKKLAWLLDKLSSIDHIKRVRIHTRAPIVTPERINSNLLRMLKQQKIPVIFVIHCNHPQEINTEVAQKLNQIRSNNFILLNQTVLLKGINDKADILIQLCEKLFSVGALPYYLHILDKVKGAEHFRVSENKAKLLLKKMQETLPGYLVPKLVVDVPKGKNKIVIGL